MAFFKKITNSIPLTFALIVLLMINGVEAYSQSFTITGVVLSAEDNEPLPGATIQILGTDKGVVTDINGKYSIQANTGDIMMISYVGFISLELPVGTRSVIDVNLETDLLTIEELVVVGYGLVRKSDLTGSLSVLGSKELTSLPAINPMEALQGRVPGVQITNNSGAPGSSPIVRIRGIGTSGDPSPLFVVDGVLLNDIAFLNAADIESMQILKDASALAIYGNRGANGVVLITTKLGGLGEGTRVNVSSSYGVQVQQNRIDLLNSREFAEVVNTINPGTFNNLDALPDTDWQDLIFQKAAIQSHNVSILGGGEKNQYYFSVGYFGQEGTIPESNYERLTLKINEKFSPKKYISVGANITLSPFWQDNTRNDAPFNVYRASPAVTPKDGNGNFNEVQGVGNILADLEYTTDNRTTGIRTVGQVYLESKFLDGFTAKTSFGLEDLREQNKSFVPVFFVSAAQQNEQSIYSLNQFSRSSWVWENTLNYDKEFDNHRINAVIGYTMQDVTNNNLSLTGRNLFRDGTDFRYIDPSNIDPTAVRNGVRDANDFYSQRSYLGRVNYSYRDKYLFTATFRRDGSSKFLGDNKYGNFPALAAGWNLTNESFLSLPSAFSNFKIRGSWGRLGNDKINYLTGYSIIDNNQNGVFGQNEQIVFGQTDGQLGNPNLLWEEVTQIDIGTDIGLFNDQLIIEADYYNRLTKGTLIGLPIPLYAGNGTSLVTFNAAEFRNTGFEFNVTWQDEIGNFGYSLSMQGTTINNETEKVSAVEGSNELLPAPVGNNIVTRTVRGLPIGAFYGYVVDGIFQDEAEIAANPSLFGTQPGDLIFKDTNDDGIITGDDRTFIGSPIPDFIFGFNADLSYKNFGLSFLFQGQTGNEIFNIKETIRPAQYNYERHVIDFWRGPGTSTDEPRPTTGGNNFLPSTRYVQDGSFLRLRTITLSYSPPKTLLDKLHMKVARIYVTGTNVFTLTKYTGYSPEIGGSPLLNGISLGTFPVSSIYTTGIDFTF